MATKKILCVLIVAVVLFSFGAHVSADDQSSDSIVSLSFLDGHMRNVNSNGGYYYSSSITSSLPFVFNQVVMNSYSVNGASHILLSTGFTLDENNSLYIFNDENIYSGALDFGFAFSSNIWSNYFHPDYLTVSCSLLLGPADPLSALNQSYTLVPESQMVIGYSSTVAGNSVIYHLSFTLNGPAISDITFDPRYILFDFSWPDAIYSSPNGAFFEFNLLGVSLSFGSSDDPPPVVPDDPDNSIMGGLDYEEEKNKEAYEGAVEGADTSAFDLASFATSFGRLFDGLNYQGTDFHFMFPGSGVVPALNMQLWPETEIPFRQWIDRMPPAWLIIARFLAWFGLAWAFIHKIRALIQDINGGDEE